MRLVVAVFGVLCLGLGVASCGDDAGPTQHVLFLTDSSGRWVAEAYVAQAEAALDAPVELIDWRTGSLSIVEARQMMLDNPEKVADAEIVVLWGNPAQSQPGLAGECMAMTGVDPGMFTVADWAPFANDVGAAIDAIWAARDGRPTAIRVMDLYIASPAAWEELGVLESCQSAWESSSDAIAEVADEHGAVFVSQMDVYNGPDHTLEPSDSGLISSDGIHPSEVGGDAMAAALTSVGFEPTTQP